MTPNWCACDPANGFDAEAWFVRKRWEGGRCPCCGWKYRLDGAVIAEGVRLCSGCSEPGHLRDSQGWAALLRALVIRVPVPALAITHGGAG